MSNRSARPPQTPWLSPYLTVKDAEAALDFYQRAFGFEKQNAVPGPDGRIAHVEMRWQDALIMFGPEGAYGGTCKAPATARVQPPVSLYVYCPDVDALCARAQAAGATVVVPPGDMFWGDRMCKIEDPDGHVWNFATFKGHPSGTPAH
jgi:uncharacterized glyoxalase superfamily protein PhnB